MTMKRLLFFFCLIFLSCFHPDSNGIHTTEEVAEQCDFDLSKTDFRIDTLNSGKLVLMEGRYKVVDMNDNHVVGKDTCYLKFRAYRFWLNEVKQ